MKRSRNKAQTFLEYATLIAVVVGCLLATNVFFIRVVQDKFRQSADVFGQGGQYAKGHTRISSVSEDGINIDNDGSSINDICPTILARVSGLEREINGYEDANGQHVPGLLDNAESLENTATDIEGQANSLIAQGLQGQANELLNMAAQLKSQAQDARRKAGQRQDLVDNYKQDYPECFSQN